MAALAQIIASTHRAGRKRLVDNFFTGTPLLERMKVNDQVKTLTPGNGRKIVLPVVVNQANGGYYDASGMETFAAADTEEVSAAEYDWRATRRIPAIDAMSDWMNKGPAQIVPLWASKLKIAGMGINEDVTAAMFADPTTADTSRQIVPIEQFLDDSATYSPGGLNSADVPRWIGATTVAGGGNALDLTEVESGYLNASEGSVQPTDIVFSKTGYGKFFSLIVANQRYTGKDNRVGFENFMFNKAAVHFDSHILTTGGAFTAERAYILNLNHLYLVIGSGADFAIEEKNPTNADGYAAQVKLYHALVCDARWAQATIDNFTA